MIEGFIIRLLYVRHCTGEEEHQDHGRTIATTSCTILGLWPIGFPVSGRRSISFPGGGVKVKVWKSATVNMKTSIRASPSPTHCRFPVHDTGQLTNSQFNDTNRRKCVCVCVCVCYSPWSPAGHSASLSLQSELRAHRSIFR